MVMDKRMHNFAAIRAAMSIPLTPIYSFVHYPGNVVRNFLLVVKRHDELIQENLQLKTEALVIRSQLQRLMTIEAENHYLKSLLQSSNQIKRKILIAELLSIDSEPFVHEVVINKGSKDGVYMGQSVLDANGVMGQVTQVMPHTSRVLLINDPHSGISVQNIRNGLRAMAGGDSYTGKLKLMYVPKTADIREDDVFITSGLGDHYPEGYPVGRVLSIIKEPAHQFAKVLLAPSARLDSSRQVLLVWYKPHE